MAQEYLIKLYEYLIRGSKDDGPRLLVVSCERTRGSGLELKHRKSYLNTRNCFSVRVVKHWKSLSNDCGVPILRNIQNLTGHAPEQPAVGDCALSVWVGLDDLQRCLPTSAIL